MTDNAKAQRRAYKRAWSKAHPESVKASQEKYWERKAQEAAENHENAAAPARQEAE